MADDKKNYIRLECTEAQSDEYNKYFKPNTAIRLEQDTALVSGAVAAAVAKAKETAGTVTHPAAGDWPASVKAKAEKMYAETKAKKKEGDTFVETDGLRYDSANQVFEKLISQFGEE